MINAMLPILGHLIVPDCFCPGRGTDPRFRDSPGHSRTVGHPNINSSNALSIHCMAKLALRTPLMKLSCLFSAEHWHSKLTAHSTF